MFMCVAFEFMEIVNFLDEIKYRVRSGCAYVCVKRQNEYGDGSVKES